jgi:hypothetical protein
MPMKRTPTDDEIVVLAVQLGQLWRHGDVVRPWFRQHRDMLLSLVHGDWSWATLANALTKAGITYRTGKPWTAKWLRSDFCRAQIPLKGYRRGSASPSSTILAPNTPAVSAVGQHRDTLRSTTPPELRFKPASIRTAISQVPKTEAQRAEVERNHRLTFGETRSEE